MHKDSVFPYLWMVCGSLAFAAMSALAHALKDEFTWQVIAIARSGLAAIFVASVALAAGKRLVFPGPRMLWVRSISGSISLVCGFFALTRLHVPDVLTVTNMYPIWIALLSWPLTAEKPTLQVWLSVTCGFVGVALVQEQDFAEGNFASLLALVSSFATATAMMGLNRIKQVNSEAIVVHFSIVSLSFCLVSFFTFDRNPQWKGLSIGWPIWMLLGVGLCATIGQVFLTRAFVHGPASKVAVVGLTQVVFGMIFDILFWQRRFSLATLIGIGLVITPTGWLLLHGAWRGRVSTSAAAPEDERPAEPVFPVE